MHLRSLSLKGFKSFPDRTKLDFAPGTAVIVGPNGSGKSNITDAVLWALGEQSPLAVRGQTMQDVIFAGGHGLPSRNAAEVEVVLDNSDGGFESEFSEISIVRRLDRSGDGEYRLNGARCRLVDVLEVLSDTGLGKEMHSVVSQGRVEAIIHSKPRDRRLLIEEAAGLGKHRKRRRRAQLKLERTQDNLDRALDVEREARSRLRPLKRQAEAAELHERLERQSLEARFALTQDDVRASVAELAEAEKLASAALAERAEVERLLGEVAARREAAEEAFAEHSRAREALSGRLYAARSACERIALRLERARDTGERASEEAERRRRELALIEEAVQADASVGEGESTADRIAQIESELAALDAEREAGLESELEGLRADQAEAEKRHAELSAVLHERREALDAAERAAEQARAGRRAAEQAVESARQEAARIGAELAAVNHFLRAAGGAPAGTRSLAEDVGADEGYEHAVAAALGSLLRAGVVADLREGESLLDAAGSAGGSALLPIASEPSTPAGPPTPGAERLLDHVHPSDAAAAHVARVLIDAWVVESLDQVPASFRGIAVTRGGRVLFGSTGELRQTPAGGEERVLEQLGRRDRLASSSADAVRAEQAAKAGVEQAAFAVGEADAGREAADQAVRAAAREVDQAAEAVRRLVHQLELRREAPAEGALAVRHAELTAELRAERRLAEQVERERVERRARAELLRAAIERQVEVAAASGRAATALERAEAAVAEVRDRLAGELEADEALGEKTAAELRSCAQEEAGLQERLRKASEAVTGAEVRAQQVRDRSAEHGAELERLAQRLGFEPTPAEEALDEGARDELGARIERLARRREQLGPVNPLAKQEYEEAVAHVEELEAQRRDLESALAELQGLIRDTDKRIRESFEETFEAAAKNFEDVVQHLFPGGRGRLRLVHPEGPRPVLGGEQPEGQPAQPEGADGEAPEPPEEDELAADGPGVEVEVTPAGKSMKRLSLLSGGEKSLVALAFLFAVFLARPCPFYILDEVEAALDDLNIDRFLQLIGRFSDRAQFIVVTHQKRTMDAADVLYGVSMGGDGVSKVVSRRLPQGKRVSEAEPARDEPAAEAAA